MEILKVTTITSLIILGFTATSLSAEVSVTPNNINLNDHATLTNYYESLAREASRKLETYQRELREYEEHSYYYGRQGQDLNSHLKANIREYEKELEKDFKELELYEKMATGKQDKQFNKAKADNAKSIVR